MIMHEYLSVCCLGVSLFHMMTETHLAQRVHYSENGKVAIEKKKNIVTASLSKKMRVKRTSEVSPMLEN
ncbi:Uncharacterized protein TCM_019064 [Theobroma cacao]|uniref:Uncharacterized protein n=1 Tax=Theobroma cacao TaxID=3641 RepID=A0A061EGS4_THECC|nr:Uncharacterized protein TCM_019064 [Theobroma cacao]